MAKTIEVRKDEKEAVVETPKSEQYKEFKELVERYKTQNPVKYEQKKEALEAKLKGLKG